MQLDRAFKRLLPGMLNDFEPDAIHLATEGPIGWAARAHALGDHSVREQFADGEVRFVLTLGGEAVTLTYETWGGDSYERVNEIWAFVCGS